jgi:hypothetical protein
MRLIGASTPLASARASLKHLAVPFEAPINPAVFGGVALRTKRHGQPTVNVPSDKMAAFLSEMKTVRLRKVSTGASAGPSGLQRRASVGGVRSSHAGSHGQGSLHQSAALKKTAASSFSSLEDREEDARTGEKRKRDPDSGTQTHDSLRRFLFFDMHSTFS